MPKTSVISGGRFSASYERSCTQRQGGVLRSAVKVAPNLIFVQRRVSAVLKRLLNLLSRIRDVDSADDHRHIEGRRRLSGLQEDLLNRPGVSGHCVVELPTGWWGWVLR